MDELIQRLQQRIQRSPAVECDALCVRSNESGGILPPRRPNPPVPQDAVVELERKLGFRFPTLVRRLYIEVADGGYGPAWGINRLNQPPNISAEPDYPEMMSVEAWHRLYRREREKGEPAEYWRHWPDPSIRFCEGGCGAQFAWIARQTRAGCLWMTQMSAMTAASASSRSLTRWRVGYRAGWISRGPSKRIHSAG